MHLFATMKPERVIEAGKKAYFDVPEPIPAARLPAVAAPATR